MTDIPLNSYEVSFIVKTLKPHWNVGMEKADLRPFIPSERRDQILAWAKHNVDHEWLKTKAYNFWH